MRVVTRGVLPAQQKLAGSKWWRRFIFTCMAGCALLRGPSASAQSFSTLHFFSPAPAFPRLLPGSDGNLYGITYSNCVSGQIFRISPTGGGLFIVHSFDGGVDGAGPKSGLIESAGVLYGTTAWGGAGAGGTIFKVNLDGTGFQTIHTFGSPIDGPYAYGTTVPLTTNSDGANPRGELVLSGSTLYGMTPNGGPAGVGTLFKLGIDGSGFSVLHNFTNGIDGATPKSGLIISGTTLFGTAFDGGTNGQGTVFEINTDGTGFTTLYNFTGPADGGHPYANLLLSGGTLFGTAYGGYGGTGGGGSVFKMNVDGSGFSTMHYFTNNTDGDNPLGGLVLSSNRIYGTTSSGGSPFYGTVFGMNTNGSNFSVLYSFQDRTDGGISTAGLALIGNTLYGTTESTEFKINTDGTGFAPIKAEESGDDGSDAIFGLALSGNTLYGITLRGGTPSSAVGTLFSVRTDGTAYATLHTFTNGADRTAVGLILSGSLIYGTSEYGGSGNGAIFKMNLDGTGFTNIFSCASGSATNTGSFPMAAPFLYGSTLYGTTSSGGAQGAGTVFKVNTDGTGFLALHHFGQGFQDTSDGSSPSADVVVANNVVYGTTPAGGTNGNGVVFRVNTDGTGFATLYTFRGGAADGATPLGGLVVSGNTLYGTASMGGAYSDGTIFKINFDGTGYSTVYNFTGTTNGYGPASDLILSGNTLWGTTVSGGSVTYGGTVFKVNTDGTGFKVLHPFASTYDGQQPYGPLVLANGIVYGTSGGPDVQGPDGEGTVFAINVSASSPPILGWNGPSLTWSSSSITYSLQSATNANGPYSDVPGAVSPYTNFNQSPQIFFRLRGN